MCSIYILTHLQNTLFSLSVELYEWLDSSNQAFQKRTYQLAARINLPIFTMGHSKYVKICSGETHQNWISKHCICILWNDLLLISKLYIFKGMIMMMVMKTSDIFLETLYFVVYLKHVLRAI